MLQRRQCREEEKTSKQKLMKQTSPDMKLLVNVTAV